MNIFPWERGEAPYWVNPENGIHWYVADALTEWCYRESLNAPPLEATVMYVAEKREGKIRPLSHVLLECETNAVLADTQSVEALCVKIDAIRLANKA